MALNLANRGICHPDGKTPGDHPAKDGRSFYCEEHAPPHIRANWAETASKREPQSDARDTASIRTNPTGKLGDDANPPKSGDPDKDKRAAQLKMQILTELNPKIPLGFAFICKPIPAHNFYNCWQDDAGKLHPVLNTKNNVTPTELGKAVMLSDGKAALIAAAAAEIESLPQIQMVEKLAGPYKGWAVIAAAAVAFGAQAWTVFQLRDQLLTQYQLQTSQEKTNVSHSPGAGQPAEPAQPEPEPEPGEAAETNGGPVGYDPAMSADIPDISAAV